MTSYTFGDTDLARERLRLVADTFAEPSRQALRDLPPGGRRYIVDLGCGPGYTTALLKERFPHSFTTGIDASPAMTTEARGRVPDPDTSFVVADVTAPLLLPAHVVYSRLLLGHLPDPTTALAYWADALLPAGVLVCEEPVQYRSDDPLFARYEEAVTAVVAAKGATLWAGPALDNDPPRCTRVVDRVVEHPVLASRAAAMFWRNAATWNGEPDLIEALRALEATGGEDTVMWEIRQTVWTKRFGGSPHITMSPPLAASTARSASMRSGSPFHVTALRQNIAAAR
ncbi:MAG TPA: methyltransferase domain-containing protein, partial [Acidimicrobiia bacterium]|nr:methyltransferase domain-containing protein [Acidimicrobiia bacterium]